MKYNCNHMLCHIKKDIYEDPLYWLGAAFFSGFLFSAWSWGILYVLSFLIIYEIGYYVYCSATKKLDKYSILIRIGLVAGGLMGFLIGRGIIEDDDHEKSIKEFRNRFGI